MTSNNRRPRRASALSSSSSLEVVDDSADPTPDSPDELPKLLPTEIHAYPSSETPDEPSYPDSSQSSLPLFPPTSPGLFNDRSSDAVASHPSSPGSHMSGSESEQPGRPKSLLAKAKARFRRSVSRHLSDSEQGPGIPLLPHPTPRTPTSSSDRSHPPTPPSLQHKPSSSTKNNTSVQTSVTESAMESSEESLPNRVSITSTRHTSPSKNTEPIATASTSKRMSMAAAPSQEAAIRSKRSNSDGDNGPTATAPKRARVKGDSSIRRGFGRLAEGATKGSVMAFFQKKLTVEEKKEQSARINEEVTLQREKQQEAEERRKTESKAKGKVSVLERVRKFRAKKKDQEIASGVRDLNGRKRKASVCSSIFLRRNMISHGIKTGTYGERPTAPIV